MEYLRVIALVLNFGWAYWLYFMGQRQQKKTLKNLYTGLGAFNFMGGILLLSQIL